MSPFERLLVELVRGDVQFLTVGGIACAFNGHVRATQDVDILVSAAPDNLERLLEVLRGFGEGHARELSPADFPVEPGAVRIIEEFPLDVFTLLSGLRYEDLLEHRRLWRSDEVEIPFVDVEGLLRIKGVSLRERDRMDVLALRDLARGPR
jgi:hypothetical protein